MRIDKQPPRKLSFESIMRARFYHFAKQHSNPLIDFFYNERLRRILKMINLEAKKNPSMQIILDLGCGGGSFSRVLSLQFMTIGIDIIKGFQKQDRGKFGKLNFVLADMCFLPLRSHSIDIVVCASVLSHIQDLESLLKKIRRVLKTDGIFIAGYPVETKFFKFIWRWISPWSFRFIDQSQTYWCNPITGKQECYWKSPFTHKQDYQMIRYALRGQFKVLQKEKLPFSILPDSITYYECVKMQCAR